MVYTLMKELYTSKLLSTLGGQSQRPILLMVCQQKCSECALKHVRDICMPALGQCFQCQAPM